MTSADRGRDAAVNRALWRVVNEQYTDGQAGQRWSAPDIVWGIFDIPEDEIGALGDVRGKDVAELGCGTAYFSAWLARRGARPVAVDVSEAQLATAQRCQDRFELRFPLVQADATALPLAPDSCDLVVSEYGASLWCDPDGWIGEAARILRPGGRLVFLTNSVLVSLCVPADEGPAAAKLARGQRDVARIHWSDGGVEFHPGHGELIATLRRHGLEVESLRELHAPPGARAHSYYEIAEPQWAEQWPVEDLWCARLGGGSADGDVEHMPVVHGDRAARGAGGPGVG